MDIIPILGPVSAKTALAGVQYPSDAAPKAGLAGTLAAFLAVLGGHSCSAGAEGQPAEGHGGRGPVPGGSGGYILPGETKIVERADASETEPLLPDVAQADSGIRADQVAAAAMAPMIIPVPAMVPSPDSPEPTKSSEHVSIPPGMGLELRSPLPDPTAKTGTPEIPGGRHFTAPGAERPRPEAMGAPLGVPAPEPGSVEPGPTQLRPDAISARESLVASTTRPLTDARISGRAVDAPANRPVLPGPDIASNTARDVGEPAGSPPTAAPNADVAGSGSGAAESRDPPMRMMVTPASSPFQPEPQIQAQPGAAKILPMRHRDPDAHAEAGPRISDHPSGLAAGMPKAATDRTPRPLTATDGAAPTDIKILHDASAAPFDDGGAGPPARAHEPVRNPSPPAMETAAETAVSEGANVAAFTEIGASGPMPENPPQDTGELVPLSSGPDVTGFARAAERAAPTAQALPAGLGQQLAEAAARFPDRPLEVTLSPEELGRVRMSFATQDGALTMLVLADRPETLDLLRRHIDQLAQDFRDLGFQDLTFRFGDQPDPRQSQARAGGMDEAEPEPESQPKDVKRQPAPLPVTADGGLDLRL